MEAKAAAAIRSGDAAGARAALDALIAAGRADPSTRLALARACRAMGDEPGEAAALDALLATEPRHVEGLLMRAQAHDRRGDQRAATTFYQAALAAARTSGPVPPYLAEPLRLAAGRVQDAGNAYQRYLADALVARGADPERSGPRFREALDILFGRRPASLQRQRPSVFYLPGLPQKAYYERSDFAWSARLEAETEAIKAELVALINDGADFRPYVEQEKGRPFRDFHGMTGDPRWSAFYLWRDGAIVEENAARCPRTVAALESVPMTRMGARTPSVLFSLLRPGTRIPPHHGMLNTRLICHLPLVVPAGCWLRVGGETRHWEEGQLLVFDDSIEHEAFNPSGDLRVILLFDIWRPELSEPERRAMDALFGAIDAYGKERAKPA
ncbi:aspartyl/asparaginyl beta-hydroxylase domain-containing protein [Sphingosinicella terrae]|uniref:aspartyl/asparaginyl beta-hydroxylase domain-containing protein n=1 Tax=Sphingosinicella terrae TaxID=2172047 RepID=UPI0013B44244|nr:aspartyl/asparaginyl beta-hydroxylase domain-containing protein [Sphingosinicella terrae]